MLGLMKSPLILALFSTVLAISCSKSADASPAKTPPAPADAPATPPAAAKTPATSPAAASSRTPTAPAAALKVPTVAELGSFLGNIKDGASATAAKEPLEALVKQLQTTKDAAAPAAGDTSGASGALGGLGKAVSGAVGGAAAKLGISEDVQKQISALLEKPEVKAAIGTTLEKLMNLVK